MSEDTEPEYILFQNESEDDVYEDTKELLENSISGETSYEEVYSDDHFNNPVLTGEPVLGINTSVGFMPRTGMESIKEALSELEGDDDTRLDATA